MKYRLGLTLLFLLPSLAAAQTERGETLYRQDRLLDAEKYYRAALEALPERERGPCYDRLLAIYIRLDRLDRALRIGATYEDWLRAHPQDDRLRLLQFEIGWCYFSLGHVAKAEPYLVRALADGGFAPLPDEKKLSALLYLAKAAERGGEPERTARHWRALEEFARQCLARPADLLSPALRAECTWKLAESHRARNDVARAVVQLQKLLETPLDAPARRKTLQLLAKDQVRLKDAAAAEKALREAIRVHESIPLADRITYGDLAAQLFEVLKGETRRREADEWRDRAADAYQAVLRDPGLGQPYQVGAVEAFWKLQQLYQESWQLQNALQLLSLQTEQWSSTPLLEPKLKAEGGQLELALGALRKARDFLRRAVDEMEKQDPLDLRELPRVYLNCGTSELMAGAPEEAEKLGQKGLNLYRQHRLADDVVLVDTHNLLGSSAAQTGDYARAMKRYQEGLAVCEPLGTAAASQRCNLLLNVALLHKAQGDLDQALLLCTEAQKAYETFAEPESLNLAVFQAARVSIQVGRGKIDEAAALAEPVLALCRKHKIDGGPLIATARHAQGLRALTRRELATAEKAWLEVLAIQQQEPRAPLMPRTLNYLGIVADLEGRRADAEAHFRRALEAQQKSGATFPATHFITLWRLAELAARNGDRAAARRLLEQGLDVADRARLNVYGDAQDRATYFAQFTPGFDREVEWCMADGSTTDALATHMRSRGRSLLEYMQSAGIDPRRKLTGPAGEKLKRREEELKQRLAAVRAQGWGLSLAGGEDDATQGLARAFEKTQEEYAQVLREILSASEVYNKLAAPDLGPAALARLRRELAGPRTRLLVYHFGRDRSFLFLVGDTIEAYELTVPEEIARSVKLAAPVPATQALRGTRGLILKSEPQPDVPLPPRSTRRVPLAYDAAGILIDHYRLLIADPGFTGTRGLLLRSRDELKALPVQRPDLLGETLLPAAARAKIRAERPDEILVIPDGPLHRLPLEAVLLEAGAKPHYVLDELPPLVYAPSLAVVPDLLERTRGRQPESLSLLTVSNPAYLEEKDLPKGPGPRVVLPRLPFTAVESRKVRAFFDPGRVTALEGEDATSSAVAGQVQGKEIVHLAAHGLVGNSRENLFGALALTPARNQRDPDNDGLLYVKDIYALPLRQCELAVLSACVTNVGPQAPLEAGCTIAGSFIAAGARRVVASHWSVDDAATAQLMGTLFESLSAAERQHQALPYARALQDARLALRRQARTAAPFYWAPFVLIGPPERGSP